MPLSLIALRGLSFPVLVAAAVLLQWLLLLLLLLVAVLLLNLAPTAIRVIDCLVENQTLDEYRQSNLRLKVVFLQLCCLAVCVVVAVLLLLVGRFIGLSVGRSVDWLAGWLVVSWAVVWLVVARWLLGWPGQLVG